MTPMFKFVAKCVSAAVVFIALGGIALDPRSSAIAPLLIAGTLGIILFREGKTDGDE